ncbi:MAG: DUF11 domain-containing protein, partial [Chitinophagales bacterium]|nr:DUF11 domain-containing protein [Chitinophagales bacterium]
HNTATATGTPPSGTPVSDDDTEDVPLGQTASIDIVKAAASDNYELGDVVVYTFTVTNTGNVTLSNVSVSDPLSGLSAVTPASVATLAPGAVATFSASYIVTLEDVHNGKVDNTATATGTPPSGSNVTDSDDETVTVLTSDIEAIDDTYGPYNSSVGGVTTSVLENDYLNGVILNPEEVNLTPGIPSHPNLVMNPDGTITVPAGTPAGVYTYPYTICDKINPTNCDDAVATITVVAPEIEAVDDTYGPYNSADGGVTNSVLENDKLNGNLVNPSDVNLTPGVPSHPNLVMNPDGTITVPSGTPAGVYTYPYTICEKLNPTNCDDAVATITVISPEIDAIDDTYGPYNSSIGGVTTSVLENDYLNGVILNPSDVNLTPGVPSHPNLVMNPDGTITVPAGTPAGVYTYPYTICDKINPTNCDDAVATITVVAPEIEAVDDTYGPYNSADGGTTPSVLINDMLNGNPVNPADINLTPGVPSYPGLVMNPNGTIFVPSGTPAGVYTYPYTICEKLNPTNCDNAVATITVVAPEIEAVDDTYGPYNSADGGTTPSVLINDMLNGNPVNPADINLTPGVPSYPGLVMNPNGTIFVPSGTPAGVYTYPYTICEKLNPTNCDDAVATITVIAPNIEAVDDTYGPYNSSDGGTTPSVLINDMLNGNPISVSDIDLTPGVPSYPGLVMNPNGTILVPSGTPAGVYTYPYTICDKINPANCDDAVATITVVAPTIEAVDDTYGPYNSPVGGTTPSVLVNDKLNGVLVNPSDIDLTPGVPSYPGLVMNPNGTITVPAGTPAGVYTYPYTICEKLNPTNCDDAVATITVIGVTESCVDLDLKVLLEGPFVDKWDGQTMTTKLNDLGYLPGQKPVTFFGIPTAAGQPYKIAPWSYFGAEGAGYDKAIHGPKAGYPSTVTDWVLVSLRETTSPSSTVCQKAALLHNDGSVEMISGFDCCEIDINKTYYIVVEHRNHLIVMSSQKVPVVSGTMTYDFTSKQSYRGLLGFGQKFIDGKFVMYAGNGEQVQTSSSVKDINTKDQDLWLIHNGENSQYNINDFELNGDVNVQDKNLWLENNSIFTDVPR